jgi:hypothetical protein
MRHRSRVHSKGVSSICTFVRDILAERLSEPLTLISRAPRAALVEELWGSPARLFAVVHATVPPVSEQSEGLSTFLALRPPLLRALAGRLPGHFHLYLGTRGSLDGLANAAFVLEEIERAVIAIASKMAVGEWRTLPSPYVPFSCQIYRADDTGSDLVVGRRHGDVDAVRLARTRRALAQTCPSLDRAASRTDATAVLILEYPDRSRANGCVTTDAILLALSERSDQPDIVVLVETAAAPFHAWIVADRVDLYPAGRPLPQFYDSTRYLLSSESAS